MLIYTYKYLNLKYIAYKVKYVKPKDVNIYAQM